MPQQSTVETFLALSAIPGLRHGFLLRVPSIDVDCERDEALRRLTPAHHETLRRLGIAPEHLATGEQVHSAHVEIVSGAEPLHVHFPDTDALATDIPGQYLGAWVADCGAVFLIDPVKKACAIVHSGRVGTEREIVPATIAVMQEAFETKPRDLIVQLAPCIRPPAYEVDFASQIISDTLAAGVLPHHLHDCGTCTTSDPDRYYSYREEKGRTGRMFAYIGWENTNFAK